MVFIWYLHKSYNGGKYEAERIIHRFSWGNMDLCLSLQSKLIISEKMKKNPKIVPLCDAVLFNDVEMFNRLINEGVDINERDYNGVTALWYAAQQGHYELAKILIEHGADLEVKDKYGNTPLWKAVFFSKSFPSGEIIKLLVDAGADVRAENNYGISPLEMAKDSTNFPYLDFLEKK